MAKITVYQKEYLKAYEELLKTGVNVSGLVMLTEMSYNTKEKLVEYKSNPKYKANDYSKRMNACFTHMLSTFFKIDSASKIYDAYKRNFAVAYLDNKEDDTNDYKDETMIKLNKIYNFINNLKDPELKGTELLSMIRKEITNGEIDEPLEDDYFNISFDYAKDICEQISLAGLDVKMVLISELLYEISDMETHLYRYKLFEEDYRKSITGLVNYLFSRAGIPEIYIKPIELDYYYSCLARENSVDTEDLVVFYKEKMCDSIEDVLIAPMKNTIFHHTDIGFKQESGALDNPIVSLRQNKYK
jgi:hypothetical protein